MTDTALAASNLRRPRGGRKKGWPTASARIPQGQMILIEAAAAKLGELRADFMYRAALLRLNQVLGTDEQPAD